MPWRRKWQPTPVFLPGESHWQRSLVNYSPWGCKKSDITEQLTHTHTHTQTHGMILRCWCFVRFVWLLLLLLFFPFSLNWMSITGTLCLPYHCILGADNWFSSFCRWEGILFLDGLCQPFVMPWTVALQVSLSVGFYRQKYWSGLPFPTPGNLPDPGIKPVSLVSCLGRWVLYHYLHLGNPCSSLTNTLFRWWNLGLLAWWDLDKIMNS